MPPPLPPSPTQNLFTTEEIVAQPAGFLREIIRALCADDIIRTRASILLAQLRDGGQGQGQLPVKSSNKLDPNSSSAGESDSDSETGAGKKPSPSATGVDRCLKCDEEFKHEENEKNSCQYHDGNIYISFQAWKNWDQNLNGPIDTPENRETYPEGFKWSCCGSESNMAGCIRGHHRAVGAESSKDSERYCHSDYQNQDEDEDEELPPVKRVKLGADLDNRTVQNVIAGASGAILVSTAGKLANQVPLNLNSAASPSKRDANPKPNTLPDGKKICLECKEEYWEDKNWPRSCWSHNGRLALDTTKPVWSNIDYDDEDELDTDEMREQVPEGFVYECCGESGLSKGCKWGKHFSSPPLNIVFGTRNRAIARTRSPSKSTASIGTGSPGSAFSAGSNDTVSGNVQSGGFEEAAEKPDTNIAAGLDMDTTT